MTFVKQKTEPKISTKCSILNLDQHIARPAKTRIEKASKLLTRIIKFSYYALLLAATQGSTVYFINCRYHVMTWILPTCHGLSLKDPRTWFSFDLPHFLFMTVLVFTWSSYIAASTLILILIVVSTSILMHVVWHGLQEHQGSQGKNGAWVSTFRQLQLVSQGMNAVYGDDIWPAAVFIETLLAAISLTASIRFRNHVVRVACSISTFCLLGMLGVYMDCSGENHANSKDFLRQKQNSLTAMRPGEKRAYLRRVLRSAEGSASACFRARVGFVGHLNKFTFLIVVRAVLEIACNLVLLSQ